MKKTIWKFQLETKDEQAVEMPEGSEILSVQTQNGMPCIWALVDPEAKKVKRILHTFGTGDPVPKANRKFIGTYQLMDSNLIFHLFEVL